MDNIPNDETKSFPDRNTRFGNLEQFVEELNHQVTNQGGKIILSGWKTHKEEITNTVILKRNGKYLKTIHLKSRPGVFFNVEGRQEVLFQGGVKEMHEHIKQWAEKFFSLSK
jgi:hypothetical protein